MRISYRKWAIRPWVQVALRPNFVQLLQFHLLFSVQILFRLLPSSMATFVLIEILPRKSHVRNGYNAPFLLMSNQNDWQKAIIQKLINWRKAFALAFFSSKNVNVFSWEASKIFKLILNGVNTYIGKQVVFGLLSSNSFLTYLH